MIKILAISSHIPMPDKASGDLRFFSILKSLSKFSSVTLAIYAHKSQLNELGNEAYSQYAEELENNSITISERHINTIKQGAFDAILFEFYDSAHDLVDLVRFYQPNAHVIVDSVDVHFNRLEARAQLTQLENDYQIAKKIKNDELNVYNQSDAVIAVTEKDKQLLECNHLTSRIFVIPNIHIIPDFQPKFPTKTINLLFIGGFKHTPNVDAICFFCNEVMPLLRNEHIDIRLNIVGSSPTPDVLALAATDVTIIGYVPSVAPYYADADIVIAPLRYGGGMKGKVGEAFSYSTPVVMTNYGVEGFDVVSGQHFLLANTPKEFAEAIVKLATNTYLYQTLAKNAWEFIGQNYSVATVEKLIRNIFSNLDHIKSKKIRIDKKLRIFLVNLFNQYILWRIKKA